MEINQAAPKFQDVSIAPMHTAEHLLNGTMVKMFGCERSKNVHIERKKSKCDYLMQNPLKDSEIREIEEIINDLINKDLQITVEFVEQKQVRDKFDLSRLPDNASELVRIVRIGDYDECLCVGTHVNSTLEIGHFRISSTRYENGIQRIVFRLDDVK